MFLISLDECCICKASLLTAPQRPLTCGLFSDKFLSVKFATQTVHYCATTFPSHEGEVCILCILFTFIHPHWFHSSSIPGFSPRPWVFASMISLMRPAPTLFLAASFTLYQVPQRRLSNLKERSLELMKTSFHSSVLSTEYCSTKPVHTQIKTILITVLLYYTILSLWQLRWGTPFAPTLASFTTLVPLLSTRWQSQTILLLPR